jgi:hypothetical protein
VMTDKLAELFDEQAMSRERKQRTKRRLDA